jgi:hypothetical protein
MEPDLVIFPSQNAAKIVLFGVFARKTGIQKVR